MAESSREEIEYVSVQRGRKRVGPDRGEELRNEDIPPHQVLHDYQRPTSEHSTTAGERHKNRTAAQPKPSVMRSFLAVAKCLHLELNAIMECSVKALKEVFPGYRLNGK